MKSSSWLESFTGRHYYLSTPLGLKEKWLRCMQCPLELQWGLEKTQPTGGYKYHKKEMRPVSLISNFSSPLPHLSSLFRPFEPGFSPHVTHLSPAIVSNTLPVAQNQKICGTGEKEGDNQLIRGRPYSCLLLNTFLWENTLPTTLKCPQISTITFPSHLCSSLNIHKRSGWNPSKPYGAPLSFHPCPK